MSMVQQGGGGAQRPPTRADLPKTRTFIVKKYIDCDDTGKPITYDVAVSAHSLEYDMGGVFFKTLQLRNEGQPDVEVIVVVSRAFAAGTWDELEEFTPSGLIQ